MTGRAALAALALAAPAAADVPGRLSISVSAGGGWASDPFLGAGAGDNGFAQVAPAARLDLALAPEWKLAIRGDAFYGAYQPSGFSTLLQRGEMEGRWLPGGPWELSLSASMEQADFDHGAPLDPDLVASPTVTASFGWRLAPAVTLRAAGVTWRLSGSAAGRRSTVGGEPVQERIAAAQASAVRPLGQRLDLGLSAGYTRSSSDRQDVAFGAASLGASAGVRILEATRLETLFQVQRARFDTGAQETLVRLTVAATQPISERVDLEVAWSFAGNLPDDPSRTYASRQVVLVGLAGRSGALSW